MKKIILFLILGIFLLSLASAQTQINYYVYENKVLVEYYFEEVSNLELNLPYDVVEPEVNVEYSLNENLLFIESGENVSIKYITKSLIDKSGKEFYFTSKNLLNEISNVKLVLPQGFILVEGGLLFPEPSEISSDGVNIILHWNSFEEEQIVIKYKSLHKNNLIWSFVFVILVFAFILLNFPKFKKKKILKKPVKIKKVVQESEKEKLTMNLFGDEKRIIEYLLKRKNNESWTKELVKDLGISKVKLSRKLRSLVQKELIKKVPWGNENKIRLLKK